MKLSQTDELKRFKIAAEQSNEMIIFADPEGIVQWANRASELITGFSTKEIIGIKAGVLWGKLMPADWYKKLWKTIKKDKKTFNSEIQNHRKNGEHFWSTITIYPLLDKDKNVQFFVSTQRDITHEKAIDLMKSDFISLASHQLRTPLSAMKWFLEMLLNGDLGHLTDEQKGAINNIDQSNERMIDLVNSLLNISRVESGKIIIEPILTDLIGFTKSIVKELEHKFIEKKQDISIVGAENVPNIMLDQKLIRQVFLNILSNANRYTPVSGKIQITIQAKDAFLVTEISDNGYGIPTNEQDQIFERFFRASNIIKLDTIGTGLGLYLSKQIISIIKGKIWFESIEGKGTKFWFTIPTSGMKAKSGEVRLN